METKNQLKQIHENFQMHIRYFHQRHPMMKVEMNDDVLICDSGLACDTFNIITNLVFSRSNINTVRDYIRTTRRPFSCWVGPGRCTPSQSRILEENGFEFVESEKAMWLDLNQIHEVPPIENFAMRKVLSDSDVLSFAHITASNWTPPDQNVIAFYTMIAGMASKKKCPIEFFIGNYEDEPVCTAEVVMENNVAGLYNVSTRASHRRKGLGWATTMFCLLEAKKRDCTAAVLQASVEGVPLYKKIGFIDVGEYQEYRLNERFA